MPAKQTYEFGPFRLDPAERLLLRDGKQIPLTPKAFDTLVLLVENHGHLLKKDELMKQVWPETFVEEVNLAQNISAIRRALETNGSGGPYIETVPKVGYRFAAQARKAFDGSLMLEPTPASTPKTAAHLRLISPWVIGIATLVLIGFIASFPVLQKVRRSASGPASSPVLTVRSIAVLPLVNLSSDPAQEYFSDGLTDELITRLAQIGTLQVISRTSVMGYKRQPKKTPEIGQELHVDALVEGTVERIEGRVRIRVQLIRTATDQHIWAQTYDRELKDILNLETQVAWEIAQRIGQVTSERPTRLAASPLPSPAAYENYLKGRYRWNQRTEAGLRAGIGYFEKAIELDAAYAPPYAGLADCYIMLANWGFMPAAQAYPKAMAAAKKALDLDDQLAEAHTSLAYASFLYDWDWTGAEKKFLRAIELNPNYATAHHFYSIYLMAAGRHKEAVAEILRARELDPLSLIINAVVGWIYYEGREYEQGIRECEKAVDMDPNYVPALTNLGMIYLKNGQYAKAIARFEHAEQVAGQQGVVLSYLAQARALSGNRAEALRILNTLDKPGAPLFISAWDHALIYVALDDKQKALAFLEQAANQHVGWVVRLGVDPALDSLRGEPRFKELERRIRVPV